MKREGKTVSSLLRDEVAHGSTVYQYLDRSMIEGALVCQWILAEGFVETADFDGRFLGVSVFLVLGPGLQEEGWFYRACFADLQRCLVVFGDYSFPDSSVSVSMALIRGCRRLVSGQSRAR